MATPVNLYMYESPVVRVVDRWGRRLYVPKRYLESPLKVMLPICRKDGLRRSYTPAGKDGLNMIHRENIERILDK